MVLLILIQRTAQDGGGLLGGGGTMGGMFTARGSANIMTRVTAILATLFIVTSMLLTILASPGTRGKSMVEQIAPLQQAAPAGDATVPAPEEGMTPLQPKVPNPMDSVPNPMAPAPAPAVPMSK